MTDELHQFLSDANREFGDNTAIILDEKTTLDVEVVPSGISVVDEAIGVGGIPRGRITEIFGNEGCGKTTMCLHVIAQAHKMGLNAAIVDVEHALSPDRMKALGVDTSKLVISQPDTGEQALDIVEMMIRSGKFAVIVVDSVAALTPAVEIEKDMGESVMGVHARLMSQAMRKLTAPTSKHKVALMFTNQTRAQIGSYGGGQTTTGGSALRFYASLRLKMQYVGKITNSSGEQISGKYKMTVVKNKLTTPFKVAQFELNQYGIDETASLIELLVEKGVLSKSGSFYRFEDEVIAQGVVALSTKLHEDPELKNRVMQALHK